MGHLSPIEHNVLKLYSDSIVNNFPKGIDSTLQEILEEDIQSVVKVPGCSNWVTFKPIGFHFKGQCTDLLISVMDTMLLSNGLDHVRPLEISS